MPGTRMTRAHTQPGQQSFRPQHHHRHSSRDRRADRRRSWRQVAKLVIRSWGWETDCRLGWGRDCKPGWVKGCRPGWVMGCKLGWERGCSQSRQTQG
eukprot:scaffold366340_cov44-Prasinocladus_malaysianus.AAC.1